MTQPILLKQIAKVAFAPAIKRGDAGFNGKPAVILGVQKQPSADTVQLTRQIEAALADLKRTLPTGLEAPHTRFVKPVLLKARSAICKASC